MSLQVGDVARIVQPGMAEERIGARRNDSVIVLEVLHDRFKRHSPATPNGVTVKHLKSGETLHRRVEYRYEKL